MEQRSFKYVDRLPMGTGGKVWWILYPVLIYFGVQLGVGLILGFVAAFSAIGDLAPLAISDPAAFQEQYTSQMTDMVNAMAFPLQVVSTIACLAVFIPLFFRDMKKFALRPNKIEKSGALTWIAIPFVIWGLAFTFLFIFNLFKLYEVFPDMSNLAGILEGVHPILTFLAIAVLTPIMEEFFFRGLLFKRLRGVMGFIPAALISSLFFGIMHLTPPQIIYTSILGFILAYIYEKKGSIWVPIFGHFCLNGLLIVIDTVFGENFGEDANNILIIAISAVVFAGALLLLITSMKKIPAYEPPAG
ncbi:MAG: CPBP family intramembrane metalloprotease [Ruminococcus sp.]|jgi:membrane protease YdiL (CAAX protease family)|nr:CPBP family intramembrane metalloprotease [Ruminococcus sp.]